MSTQEFVFEKNCDLTVSDYKRNHIFLLNVLIPYCQLMKICSTLASTLLKFSLNMKAKHKVNYFNFLAGLTFKSFAHSRL